MAKKHYTLAHIRRVEGSMTPCPFCGKKPKIFFSDDEGNRKRQDSEEYLKDPWSGLAFWIAHKAEGCPIRTTKDDPWDVEDCLPWGYDTPEEAAAAWNKRYHEDGALPAG